jgi:hypothetical protein
MANKVAPMAVACLGPLRLPSRIDDMKSTLLRKTGLVRNACAVLFLMLVSGTYCRAADIVFIRSTNATSAEQEQLEIAAKFYGVNLKVFTARSADNGVEVRRSIEQQGIVGIAIEANALALVDKSVLQRASHRKQRAGVPLLIFGATSDTAPALLASWSGGAVQGCQNVEGQAFDHYAFGRIDGLTEQLSGLEIPSSTRNASRMVLGEHAAEPILSMGEFPEFIETTVRQQKVFVACATRPDETLDPNGMVGAFLRVAPAMMFIRYCAGDAAWHAIHHYANFTIDDPWLREPYGYVDYQGLLEEMERHDFHTTIAFIPWNFDRSDPAVAALFRSHPDQFSIAVHGDNHDHKEFTDYQSKPLNSQISAMKQSLARMNKFQGATGIPYDKVMIFPHSIAPRKTLAGLKEYNYLATVNSMNVPQGEAQPTSVEFALRSVTMDYAGFPSLRRYSIAGSIPPAFVAVSDYLDNPLLFYGHAEDFAKGIDAFDGIADEVNTLDPGIRWRNLADTVRHLYLVRLRDDSNYDVLAFSSDVCLENTFQRDTTFYVQKREFGGQIIESVAGNGQSYPYALKDGYLSFTVEVPKDGARCVAVTYQNDLNISSVATSGDSQTAYLLRMASDFRDIYLSKWPGGVAFIRFYDDHGISPTALLGLVLVLMGMCIYLGYRLRGFVRARRFGHSDLGS